MKIADQEFWNGVLDEVHKADLTREMEREFRTGWHMDDVRATLEQKEAAYVNHNIGRRFLGHGLGQVTMSISPKFYHDMIALYGPECWRDKDFKKSVLKKNPECRVKSYSDKPTLRVQGLKTCSSGEVKFRKKY